jgi:membrane-associated phospholipid phosphatase
VSTSALASATVGALILAASVLGARGPVIRPWEQRTFHAVNGLPGWLFVPLWPVMQLGNLAVGTAAGLVVAWCAGELPVAIGVALAAGLKLAAERLIRNRITTHLPARQRPGTSQTDAILRGGDVPSQGWSFPSGHAVLIAAITLVVAPVLPTGWELVPAVLTLGVMVGRVYVGAHNPLDVTSGAGAGLLVGGLVAALIP